MKSRLHAHGCVANPRHSDGYGCGLRLAPSANPSISSLAHSRPSIISTAWRMNRPISIITALLVAGFCSVATAEPQMTDPFTSLSVPEDFQGIVIEGPAEVSFQKKKVERPVGDRSNDAAFDHFGGLNIKGRAQIHTPEGKQYQTWFRFDKRLTFVVKDLKDNAIQRSSYVDGGWILARKGVSVLMEPHPDESVSEPEFNKMMEGGKVISRHFTYQLDDHLPTLYSEPTTLEIHAEYLGFRSNTILVKVHVTGD